MNRKIAVFVALVAGMVGSLAAPSLAASRFFSKTTGTTADAYWTQVDGTPVGTGPFGNVHIGFLYAYEMSDDYVDVFAYIDDFDCPPGQLPGDGGHGIVDEPGGCAYIGSRFGSGQDMVLTIDDRRLDSAHLVGSLVLESGGGHGEGGQVVGNPPVDITWTGAGNLAKGRSTYRYTEGGTTYSFSERSTYRQASLDGYIGAMSFDPDLSGGSISHFSNTSKERTK
jgi:hypothetical protein